MKKKEKFQIFSGDADGTGKDYVFRSTGRFSIIDLLKMIGIMAAAILLGLFLYREGVKEGNIIMILILGVLLTARQTRGILYGVLASLIGMFGFNFFFAAPRLSFHYTADYPFTFIVMLIVALITSTLTSQIKSHAETADQDLRRMDIILETNHKLQHAETIDEIVMESERQIYKTAKKPIVFYTVEEGKISGTYSYDSEQGLAVDKAYLDEGEREAVNWVLENKKTAGKGTGRMPEAKVYYLPISSGKKEVFAVIGFILTKGDKNKGPESSLLTALFGQIAFALERYSINLKKNQTARQAESERLRANLLRAISHDLRTPLTNISGSASSLLSTDFDQDTKAKLTQGIYDDAVWLVNLVENLLSVSKLDHNAELKTEPQLVEELVTDALSHLSNDAASHTITTHIEDPLLMAQADGVLIVQVLINIINNAINYTPENSHIAITAAAQGRAVMIKIADDGKGIRDEEKGLIFDMYFTGKETSGDARRGLGLGLALCKSIINAHGGDIQVKDNVPSGTIFECTLPLAEVTTNENFNSDR